ncbi:ferritin-like domain-containing protein [soil metagenome]
MPAMREGAREEGGSTAERRADPDPAALHPLPERDPRVALVLGALAYGERCGAERSSEAVRLAPDNRSRLVQQQVADREWRNCALIEARLHELGGEGETDRFRPFFDAFFQRTRPGNWVEAQTFHYVGDALVSDFADVLVPRVDPVSAEIVRRTLGDREDLETFALDELTRTLSDDPGASEAIRRYSERIIGEAFTQTGRALEAVEGLRSLLEGGPGTTRLVVELLERHRVRLDRLGIEPVEEE